MSVVSVIAIASMAIQVAAASIALGLMRITRTKWAWAAIATALVLRVALRCMPIYRHFSGDPKFALDFQTELLALAISILFLAGFAGIAPLFRAFRQSEEDLRLAHDDLERRVQIRTAELAMTNDELQQERYLLHTLMDYLPHNIYFKDSDSRFIRINSAMSRFFGLNNPNDAIGKTDVDFFSEEHAQQAKADELEIVRTGQPILDKEEKETWPDGHWTWASSTKLPLFDVDGKIVGTFGISQDITAQKKAAEALRTAKEAAEAASRAKSTFLANMSHEIRTPLNAVIGMTELVLKSQLSAQQREFLSTVRDSGHALLSVINDILDFSKIEAEKLVLSPERFNVRERLGDTMKSFAIRAHQQGLELACHVHHDVPPWAIGDYNRLRQIVVNLVNNAIKFTDQGEVALEVAMESQSDTDLTLHFTVSDTGIGIPPDKHGAIFGMFEQVDSSTTRRYGGTGLGLAIASRLIHLMQGRIWLESEVNRGSRFHFIITLGVDESETEDVVHSEPAVLHGMRVLVVDDNATNRRILDEVLGDWQMVSTSVEGAEQAIAQLRNSELAKTPYRLVVTDAHMPKTDGFMLAKLIRDDPELGEPVIMMLTSGDRPEDTTLCERLAIAAYLLKPVKPSELLEAIEMAIGVQGSSRERTAPVDKHAVVGPLHILLAEDSLMNQRLAVALLQSEGHSVRVVNNGRDAVTVLESGSFDLVLMDVQMPEMDGLEATVVIRARERGTARHIPIIAMTAHALKGDRDRCIEAGMDGYVTKPINADEFFAEIARLMPGSVQARSNDSPATAPAGSSAASSSDPALLLGSPSSDVEWHAALKSVRGDRQLLAIIVDAALGEIPQLIAAIHRAIENNDAKSLRLSAHTLKGSVRYFSASTVLELAMRLEALGQEGNLRDARPVADLLDEAGKKLLAALSKPSPFGDPNSKTINDPKVSP